MLQRRSSDPFACVITWNEDEWGFRIGPQTPLLTNRPRGGASGFERGMFCPGVVLLSPFLGDTGVRGYGVTARSGRMGKWIEAKSSGETFQQPRVWEWWLISPLPVCIWPAANHFGTRIFLIEIKYLYQHTTQRDTKNTFLLWGKCG